MPTFVDSSGWIAAKNWRDRRHTEAVAALAELADRRERLVTTDFVLDETYTVLLQEVGYAVTVVFKRELDGMAATGTIRMIHVTPEIQTKAWDVFERFNRDKLWSFTDCTSYIVMREAALTEAFAYDDHFWQMGFIPVARRR